MKIHVQELAWTHVFNFLRIYLGVELLGNVVAAKLAQTPIIKDHELDSY